MLAGGVAGYAVNALYDATPLPMTAIIAAMGLGALLCYHAVLPEISRAGPPSSL